MKRGLLLMSVMFFFLTVVFPGQSHAAVYKYVTQDGTVGFADNLQSVPEEYRQTAILIRGKLKKGEIDPDDPRNFIVTGGSQSAGTRNTPGMQTSMGVTKSETENKGAAPFSRRLLRSFLVLLAAAALYFILFALGGDLKERKKALPAARITLISLVSVFLIYSHARDVVTIFTKTGNEVENVKKRAEEKGKRAANFIKALDAYFE